ncbi:uncharacterized protein L203_100625 [Cryptococcus depauperatus CBS 7841]|uniref:Uncharacterized protein n=1 Tax=Cryptococcus depauperatus CBS 7841 TaxID=1295531 RepID=A0A1E3IZL1_9TREE|nr:hypothetical protein L203_00410 [Cryptococcus depauperatus CBS 7841]
MSEKQHLLGSLSNNSSFLATSISVNGRHTQSYHSGRLRRRENGQGVGGSMVGDMKKGLRIKSDHRRPTRLKALMSFALILFIILTTIWIVRLSNRIKSLEGWNKVVFRLQKALGDRIVSMAEERQVGRDL